MKLDNRTYDRLKWIAQILLPALGTFIFAIGKVWDFETEKIVGTITAVDAFLGALLQISSNKYYQSLTEENEV